MIELFLPATSSFRNQVPPRKLTFQSPRTRLSPKRPLPPQPKPRLLKHKQLPHPSPPVSASSSNPAKPPKPSPQPLLPPVTMCPTQTATAPKAPPLAGFLDLRMHHPRQPAGLSRLDQSRLERTPPTWLWVHRATRVRARAAARARVRVGVAGQLLGPSHLRFLRAGYRRLIRLLEAGPSRVMCTTAVLRWV